MIPPQKLSTIAERYNPDLLNEWLDPFIKQNSYALFFSLKAELLKAENHPEWFLKLLNLAHRNQNNFLKYNVNIWNDFIKICKKEDKNFTIDFSGCTFENEEECSFSGIELPNINFYKATFEDKANFGKAVFKDKANFEKTAFKDKANFGNTIFEDGAIFENATFENEINFGIKNLKNINFKNTTFNSKIDFQNKEFINTSFERAIFKKTPNFGNTTFEDEAIFENTIFEDEANFWNTTFADLANFQGVTFKNKPDFQGATFKEEANFENATFKYEANFGKTTFENKANFEKATFENEANFKKAIFKEEANFQRVKFKSETDFFDAIFDNIDGKKIDFSNTTFEKNVKFDFSKEQANTEKKEERYAEISFENATFEKEATFRRRKFAGDTNFIDAKFYYPPTFSAGEEYNPDLLNFTRTKLILSDPPQTASLYGKNIDSKKITRVRNLRKLAGQINEHDFEIDLFILERLLNSRINFKSKNFVLRYAQQILIIFYWGLADYSRKAWLPAIWLLYSIVVLKDYLDKYVVKNSECNNYDLWLVSSSSAIPFFNKFSEKSKFILQRCFTDSCTVESIKEIPNMVFVYFTIHSLFSIVMIFLFSLAIRNYFRIK